MYERLTNENLRGLFKSNFELARFAIRLGKYYLKSGKEMHLTDILDEIEDHPDESYVDELISIDEKEKEEAEETESS